MDQNLRSLDALLIDKDSKPRLQVLEHECATGVPRDPTMFDLQFAIGRAEKRQRHMVAAAQHRDRTADDQLPTGTVAVEHRQPRFAEHDLGQSDQRPQAQANQKGL